MYIIVITSSHPPLSLCPQCDHHIIAPSIRTQHKISLCRALPCCRSSAHTCGCCARWPHDDDSAASRPNKSSPQHNTQQTMPCGVGVCVCALRPGNSCAVATEHNSTAQSANTHSGAARGTQHRTPHTEHRTSHNRRIVMSWKKGEKAALNMAIPRETRAKHTHTHSKRKALLGSVHTFCSLSSFCLGWFRAGP